MAIPVYVDEGKSDVRCIKPGWYAMNEDGSLCSGAVCQLRRVPQWRHSADQQVDIL
jgi:hypothetical protein